MLRAVWKARKAKQANEGRRRLNRERRIRVNGHLRTHAASYAARRRSAYSMCEKALQLPAAAAAGSAHSAHRAPHQVSERQRGAHLLGKRLRRHGAVGRRVRLEEWPLLRRSGERGVVVPAVDRAAGPVREMDGQVEAAVVAPRKLKVDQPGGLAVAVHVGVAEVVVAEALRQARERVAEFVDPRGDAAKVDLARAPREHRRVAARMTRALGAAMRAVEPLGRRRDRPRLRNAAVVEGVERREPRATASATSALRRSSSVAAGRRRPTPRRGRPRMSRRAPVRCRRPPAARISHSRGRGRASARCEAPNSRARRRPVAPPTPRRYSRRISDAELAHAARPSREAARRGRRQDGRAELGDAGRVGDGEMISARSSIAPA